jgi:GT2 family glycosyltransferase
VTRPITSVVVPALDAAATIGMQLEALSRQVRPPDEIVVVDNGSSDATVRVVEGWIDRLPGLHVTSCDGGVNRARNHGVRTATGTSILMCDADDVVAPAWAAALGDALARAPLVGGRLDLDTLNPRRVVRQQPDPTGDGLPRWNGTPYAVGANWAFRRDVFDAIGGFDEEFRFGSDEIDFCLRAERAGFPAAFEPRAVVAYRFKPTPIAFVRQYCKYGVGNAQLYAKHRSLGTVPRRSTARQSWTYAAKLRRALPIWNLLSAERRWTYLRDLGMFAGTNVGLVRFGLVA